MPRFNLFNFLKPKDQFQEYADSMKPLQPVQDDEQGSALYNELMKNTNPTVQQSSSSQTQPLQAQSPTLYEAITDKTSNTDTPEVTPVQVNLDGSMKQNTETHAEVPTTWKDKLGYKIWGVPEYQNNDSIDTSGNTINATISSGPRRGGLYNDIVNGAKENYATGFAAPNLTDKYTSDGRPKGFAYRFGETLGSLGRFAESAPGRALITAGLVGLTGGDGLDALAYGGQAGALNNRLRTQDRMYRNEMIKNAQNQIMNSPQFNTLTNEEQQYLLNNVLHTNPEYMDLTEEEKKGVTTGEQYHQKLQEKQDRMKAEAFNDYLRNRQQQQLNNAASAVDNMRGYVTNDMYKNFVESQQLRDNADWKRLYFDNQQEQNRIMNQLRRDQLEAQKANQAAEQAYRNATLGLGYAKLSNDNANQAADRELKKEIASATLAAKGNSNNNTADLTDLKKQLNNFESTFKTLPNKAESYTFGNIRALTGMQTTKEANFNAQRTLLFNQIARKLGGEKGVLSDQDIKRIEAALPKLTDSYSQKKAKMKAVRDLLTIRQGGTPTVYRSGKYKVRVK